MSLSEAEDMRERAEAAEHLCDFWERDATLLRAEVTRLREELDEAVRLLRWFENVKNLRPAAGDNSQTDWLNATLNASMTARAFLARSVPQPNREG